MQWKSEAKGAANAASKVGLAGARPAPNIVPFYRALGYPSSYGRGQVCLDKALPRRAAGKDLLPAMK